MTLDERYRPTRQLGSGGFGRTYLAEDGRKFNEQCVIKQLAPQVQGTGALGIATRLFEEEARRLQQLGQHPRIPTLLAYFEQDNRLYLVQEYIEGQNLLDELDLQGAFSEQKIRELLFDLLDILKSVHQENVIHRDIKPENIIRRKTDSKLVLIDFGASKQLSGTIITKPGTTIGTFGYAPPEQMEGGEAYPASDLYSLGATCFHLLSDINPWELWKRQAYGWINNWRQHLRQPVSQEVGRVLDKLLQEDYQQRHKSAEAALQDLNRQPLASFGIPPKVSPPPQPLPKPLTVSPKASPQPQPSSPLPVLSCKQKAEFKNLMLVGGVIVLLTLVGYGYWQSRPDEANRGTVILEAMKPKLIEMLHGKPWTQVERLLLKEERIKWIDTIQKQVLTIDENELWQVTSSVSGRSDGYQLELQANWQGSRVKPNAYSVVKSCRIAQVPVPQSAATKPINAKQRSPVTPTIHYFSQVKCVPEEGWGGN